MSVTVLITCCNEGPYLGQAVESVLGQTADAEITEIHVLDDGSDEATRAVIRELAVTDTRIGVHLFDRSGVAGNRNRGLSMVTTEFVAFLDGDDIWERDKLERQLCALRRHPSALLCYTGYRGFLDGDSSGRDVRVPDLSVVRDPPKRYFLDGPSVFPSTVLARTEAVARLDDGFIPDCTPFEDFELFFRLLVRGPFIGIPEPMVRKRYRKGSLSSRSPTLMARHAFASFRAAMACPRLLPLVPVRIAERARRLALVHFYASEFDQARALITLALKTRPFSLKTWATAAITGGGASSLTLLKHVAPERVRLHLY